MNTSCEVHSSSQTTDGDVGSDTLRSGSHELFVIGVWVGLSSALFAFVYAFGSQFPYVDDVALLVSWAGERTPTWRWFFRPWNGHVLPFESASLVGCWAFADGNLRPLLLCNAGLLAIASLWVLAELRRMKGRLDAGDCLIPLAMLGCHSYFDAMWAIMWYNLLAAGLTATIAATILRRGSQGSHDGVGWLAAATSLLAFQGGPGLLAALGFVPAVALLAWKSARACRARTPFVVLAMGLLVAAVSVMLACVVLARPEVNATGGGSQSLVGSLIRVARPLSLPAGWLSIRIWPVGTALVGSALAAVVWGALRQRTRSAGATLVALTLIPGLLVCAGIAASRDGLVNVRYIGMLVPLWVPLHFGMHLVVSTTPRQLFTLATVIVLAISYGFGLSPVIKDGRARKRETQALQAGIDAGQSFDQLAASHGHAWGWQIVSGQASENLEAIASIGKGAFARIPKLPTLTFTTTTMPAPAPGDLTDQSNQGGRWRCADGGVMRVALPAEKLDAVRLVFDTAVGSGKINVGIGACVGDSDTWRTSSYEERLIGSDREAKPGERPTYTLTYLLPPNATSVVLVVPAECRDLSLQSVATGRLNHEQTTDGPP